VTEIPVVLFAYARPDNLARTLACLRQNNVPRIFAFSDGPRSDHDASKVEAVRCALRAIDWCDIKIIERENNLGLGRSILAGVTAVLSSNDSVIVFEDDLVCVPGTYAYLSSALRAYANDHNVMSVTGWTHPRITPGNITDQPYFDGRAECWVWGTWAHAWEGMDQDAKSLMNACAAKGIDPYQYGSDLVDMANTELERNIWAVRLLYLHMLRGALCMRPPWSMVDHIGFDSQATNAGAETWLRNPVLRNAPPTPRVWPPAIENPECARLHRSFVDGGSLRVGFLSRAGNAMRSIIRGMRSP
jgi:hypothetical protein